MNDHTEQTPPDLGPGKDPALEPDAPSAGEGAHEATSAALARAAEERDRLEEQLKRVLADLQNLRKRQAKEIDEAHRRAVEGLTKELLPVLDNFERALLSHEHREAATADPSTRAIVDGVRMVQSLLHAALERHGLVEVPGVGQPFDPNVHEAIGVDAGAQLSPGSVARVLQRGYAIGDRVLRPAKVLVVPHGRLTADADAPRTPGDRARDEDDN